MNSLDSHAKSIQTLTKIQQAINSFHQQLVSRINQRESQRLQEYKNQLLTKKIDFEKINVGRSENAITQNIMSRKKVLEKQCANSLQKSMKANKMYEQLKQKLNCLQAEEREMEQETKYLQKRIVVAEHKNKNLKKLKKQLQEEYQSNRMQNKEKIAFPCILGQIDMNKNKEKSKVSDDGPKKETKLAEKRLIFRIQCIKEYLDSLIFVKTDLESIFDPYLNKTVGKMSKKDKLQLGEQILTQPSVKRQLYQLLFPQ